MPGVLSALLTLRLHSRAFCFTGLTLFREQKGSQQLFGSSRSITNHWSEILSMVIYFYRKQKHDNQTGNCLKGRDGPLYKYCPVFANAVCWPEVLTYTSCTIVGLHIHAVGLWRLGHKGLKLHRTSTRVADKRMVLGKKKTTVLGFRKCISHQVWIMTLSNKRTPVSTWPFLDVDEFAMVPPFSWCSGKSGIISPGLLGSCLQV